MLFLFRSIESESDEIRSVNRPKVIVYFHKSKRSGKCNEKDKAMQAIAQRKVKAVVTHLPTYRQDER